ncbi:hypothetical protein M3_0145 [Lysinibacillus phage vB_LfM_LysYB1]|nr:hypothetical protein M3_0145 [Lysinibacillus phage vB_LfM_LysYB1]WAB25344.1 hypothetical protein M5_0166 [Lysinibacillus phage vB_LfM_LysYB2]
MDNRETIMVIKDSLFELVIGGMDLRTAMNTLHHVDKHTQADILQAVQEMRREAEEAE